MSPKRPKNFADLVDTWCRRDIKPPARPRTRTEAAEAIGISRAYLFRLIAGEKTAGAWVVANAAVVFGCSEKVVDRALAQSRAEGGLFR